MTERSPAPLAALVRKLSETAIVRFGVVGVSNAVVSFATFWTAHHFMPAAGAQCASYIVGMLWSYYWNRRWTFQSQARVTAEASRFLSSQIAFMLLSSASLGLLVDRWHYPAILSWFGVMSVVTAANFLVSRYWAFKRE